MAVLLTLAEAKKHLRVTTVDHDSDIWDKTQEAQEIVIGFLKGRILEVDTLTSSGGVATLTTTGAHGLTTGDTVFVRGAGDSEYNGEVVVTVTGATTFTYTVTGTPAATATGLVRVRASLLWTADTVPIKVKSAIKLMLTHLWEHRGDDMKDHDDALWSAVKNLLIDLRDPALA